MIRGVNKQVVDVTEPESAYFERVLFFVKPEFSGLGEGALRGKAEQLLRGLAGGRVAGTKMPRGKHWRVVIGLSLAALLGAATAAVAMLILLR